MHVDILHLLNSMETLVDSIEIDKSEVGAEI